MSSFEKSILKYYRPILNISLKNKVSTLLIFISALCIIVSLILSGFTKFTFFPKISSETVSATLTMPEGTPFDVTNNHVIYMTNKADALRQKYIDKTSNESIIKNILTTTGDRGSSNIGVVKFEIIAPEKRESTITANELANEWRKSIGLIMGAQSLAFKAERGRVSSPIDVQLSGTSFETLEEVSIQIKQRLYTYPSVFDITDTLSDGKEELNIELTKQGKALGLSRQEVSSQVKQALFGDEVQRIQRGRDDVRVVVRFPLNERQSIASLEKMLIKTKDDVLIPLSQVAFLIPTKGPASIKRIDRYRTVNITADIEKGNTNMSVFQEDFKSYLDGLLSQYPTVSYSLEGESKEQNETFSSIFWSLLIALFAIYILLAIPFKSYVQPLIVMSVIPFGIIGAVVGHWILGINLTLLSLLGILALTGVVVNDSLVLVDYINKQYKKTGDLIHAVLSAGTARFRPVILTSLTTFIGLLPLLFEKSTQAQFLIPMAASLAFGIIFATFTTLILVPVNYMLLENIKSIFKK